MKSRSALVAAVLAILAGSASAQDRSSSPYDTNPACTERTTDANSPECVVPQEGEPRQIYPPRKAAPKPPPGKPPAEKAPASPPLSPPRTGAGPGLR